MGKTIVILLAILIFITKDSFSEKLKVHLRYYKNVAEKYYNNKPVSRLYYYKEMVGIEGDSIVALVILPDKDPFRDVYNHTFYRDTLTIVKDLQESKFYGRARKWNMDFSPKNWHKIDPENPKIRWGNMRKKAKIKPYINKLIDFINEFHCNIDQEVKSLEQDRASYWGEREIVLEEEVKSDWSDGLFLLKPLNSILSLIKTGT